MSRRDTGVLFALESDHFERAYINSLVSAGFSRCNIHTELGVEKAQSLINSWEPDWVFVSDLLHDKGGLGLIKWTKTEAQCAPQVVYLQARVDPDEALGALLSGADHIFTEPVEMNSLIRFFNLKTNCMPW